MQELFPLLEKTDLFENQKQASIYLVLLKGGALGVEKIHQQTKLHRETIQRELKKMASKGTIQILTLNRNKKAKAASLTALQEILEEKRVSFDRLLKPLLEVEAKGNGRKITQLFQGNHAYGLLQLKFIKLHPHNTPVHVISTHPKGWVTAMIESRKLDRFEKIRLQKEIPFELLCFSELKGQVEKNAREYFASQPAHLKRKYRYVNTELSSPLQTQIWGHAVVMSLFESTPSIHIIIEDIDVVKAMKTYFKILWEQS